MLPVGIYPNRTFGSPTLHYSWFPIWFHFRSWVLCLSYYSSSTVSSTTNEYDKSVLRKLTGNQSVQALHMHNQPEKTFVYCINIRSSCANIYVHVLWYYAFFTQLNLDLLFTKLEWFIDFSLDVNFLTSFCTCLFVTLEKLIIHVLNIEQKLMISCAILQKMEFIHKHIEVYLAFICIVIGVINIVKYY